MPIAIYRQSMTTKSFLSNHNSHSSLSLEKYNKNVSLLPSHATSEHISNSFQDFGVPITTSRTSTFCANKLFCSHCARVQFCRPGFSPTRNVWLSFQRVVWAFSSIPCTTTPKVQKISKTKLFWSSKTQPRVPKTKSRACFIVVISTTLYSALSEN